MMHGIGGSRQCLSPPSRVDAKGLPALMENAAGSCQAGDSQVRGEEGSNNNNNNNNNNKEQRRRRVNELALSPNPRGGAGSTASANTQGSQGAETVQVCVRVRPLFRGSQRDREEEAFPALRFYPSRPCVSNHTASSTYNFDQVFMPQHDQADIYEARVLDLVENFFRGYNATILAYGQTGSGKTYTMGTDFETGPTASVDESIVGIIPRVINNIFDFVSSSSRSGNNAWEYKVKCQFLEIHNEEVKDLLCPQTNPRRIHIRENEMNDIVVQNAADEEVSTAEDTFNLLRRGCQCRTTAQTYMNAQSSRSHAIFSIALEKTSVCKDSQGNPIRKNCVRSKFHLVDLAGSERAKRTGAAGGRLKESVNINQGEQRAGGLPYLAVFYYYYYLFASTCRDRTV